MYAIYKITSPSGRAYIGLTKNSIKERWRQHAKRAVTDKPNHPFYNAIRKYGPDAFSFEQIDTATSKTIAQQKEMQHIALAQRGTLYNVSRGGEADGEAGSKIFWDRMALDPAAKKEYLAKLSSAKKSSDWTDYGDLSSKAALWRKANPKLAYQISRRGSRVAARKIAAPKSLPVPLTLKERLVQKYNGRSLAVAKMWAARDPAETARLSEKISISLKETWAKVTDPAVRSSLTAAARAGVDRKKQVPAAIAGIKKYWEDLRADPVKYAAKIERCRQAAAKRAAAKKAAK